MEILSLCCVACVAFGDGTAVLGTDGLQASASATTDFAFRTEPTFSGGAPDGMHLSEGRLQLQGVVANGFGVHGSVFAADTELDFEAFADVSPLEGLEIRAGQWITQLGPVSGRRATQRCFADAPLATSRFLGEAGLVDAGLRVRYTLPWFPVSLSAGVLSGQRGASFGAPAEQGEGGDMLERLLYVVRLTTNPGALFDERLALGFTFATSLNGTGPGNRTDLIGGDVSGMFDLGDVRLGFDLEFMMRRFSVPAALHVEGGLSADVVLGWKGLLAGARLDLMGIPTPPDRDDLHWRFTAMGGYAATEDVRFQLQYAARNDNPDTATGHEVIVHAVVGFGGRIGGVIAAPEPAPDPRRQPDPEPRPVDPRPLEPARSPAPTYGTPPPLQPAVRPIAPESDDPADWLAAAAKDLAAASTLTGAGHHALAAFQAQQAAHKALRALALTRHVATDAGDRSAIGIVESLARDGDPPPGPIWSMARELDRHYTISRYPPELGGDPNRYFDRATGTRAVDHARQVVVWVQTALQPAPEPSETEPAREPAETEPAPTPTPP